MFGLSTSELMIILVVVLLVFGPSKLPQLARSMGKALGEFRRASQDMQNAFRAEMDTDVRAARPANAPPSKPAVPAANAPPSAPEPKILPAADAVARESAGPRIVEATAEHLPEDAPVAAAAAEAGGDLKPAAG